MRWIVPLLLAVAPAQSAVASDRQPSDRISYVFFDGSGDGSAMMSGSSDDVRLAEKYRAGRSPLLYVRDGGSAYVIRDAGLLRRAEAIMAPQRQLGERQGELGRKQGELGARQAALGAEQGRLGALMANATPRQMSSLAERQAALGEHQSSLGAQQAELGERQGELGRQQARLAELARPQFRALVAEASQRGLAQRVD
jgi:bla regulator protein BlaR1